MNNQLTIYNISIWNTKTNGRITKSLPNTNIKDIIKIANILLQKRINNGAVNDYTTFANCNITYNNKKYILINHNKLIFIK